MRPELQYLEELEAYVLGTHPNPQAFRLRMAQEPSVKTDVEFMQQVQAVSIQAGIRKDISRGQSRYRIQKLLRHTLLAAGLAVVLAGIITVLWLSGVLDTLFQPREHRLPERNENGEALWSRADSVLPYQFYTLDGTKDEVVETPSGMLLSVPAGSFTDEAGNVLNGTFELEVKEAMSPLDIMRAGLETWSDGSLLETGGMFYLNARKDGKNLKIKADANVTASIPKWQDRTDMMLFDGVRRGSGYGADDEAADVLARDGRINWVNPQKPTGILLSVPMDSLNFYPPGFEAKMNELGLNAADKKIRDSVYLSLAAINITQLNGEFSEDEMAFLHELAESHSENDPVKREELLATFMKHSGRFINRVDMFSILPGIDPRSVLAFWTPDFNNTILATRAFEQRMRFLHSTCNQELLMCYVNNTDKPLYYADSLAASLAGGDIKERLLAFQAQRYGQPGQFRGMTGKLKEVFARRQQELDAVFRHTAGLWMDKQRRADAEAALEKAAAETRENSRLANNRAEEFDANLNSAYEQLGKKRPEQLPVSANVTDNFATFPIRSTGWKNVDTYVAESMYARTDMKYTAPDGKTAEIRYRDYALQVENALGYDALEAYLIPKGLMSFIRMENKNNGTFAYRCNGLITYNLVVVGYKGNDVFALMESAAAPGLKKLRPSSAAEVNSFAAQKGTVRAASDMHAELEYMAFKRKEQQRQQQVQAVYEIRYALYSVVYPCSSPYAESDSLVTGVVVQPDFK